MHIALYSHDTMGVGSFCRNLTIARALAQSGLNAKILMLAGAGVTGLYYIPKNVDVLPLPALQKDFSGVYSSSPLTLSLNKRLAMRSSTIARALKSFKPDVFIVDSVPWGVGGELDESFSALCRNTGGMRVVLGVKDIIDDPSAVKTEWARRANFSAIRAYFDEVWMYGDSRFYNAVHEYAFPGDIAAKVKFTGYFNRQGIADMSVADKPRAPTLADLNLPRAKTVLCMVGGGRDGAAIADVFSRVELPGCYNGVIVTGPYMPDDIRNALRERMRHASHWRVIDFHPDPQRLLRDADAVMTMGGYNAISDVLCLNKPTLVIPRVEPCREQLIRARRLAALQLADMCHPSQCTPEALSMWLSGVEERCDVEKLQLNFNGLARLPGLVMGLSRRRVAG